MQVTTSVQNCFEMETGTTQYHKGLLLFLAARRKNHSVVLSKAKEAF